MRAGTIRNLDPAVDRAAVEDLFARAADHVALERGPVAPKESARDFFDGEPPPGVDPARSLHLGLEGAEGLDGIAEVVFGFPQPHDAYMGLLLLVSTARGAGRGVAMLREVEARSRGARRLLVAVLDANPRGRAFWLREGFVEVARFEGVAYGVRRHDVARMAKPLIGNATPRSRVLPLEGGLR